MPVTFKVKSGDGTLSKSTATTASSIASSTLTAGESNGEIVVAVAAAVEAPMPDKTTQTIDLEKEVKVTVSDLQWTGRASISFVATFKPECVWSPPGDCGYGSAVKSYTINSTFDFTLSANGNSLDGEGTWHHEGSVEVISEKRCEHYDVYNSYSVLKCTGGTIESRDTIGEISGWRDGEEWNLSVLFPNQEMKPSFHCTDCLYSDRGTSCIDISSCVNVDGMDLCYINPGNSYTLAWITFCSLPQTFTFGDGLTETITGSCNGPVIGDLWADCVDAQMEYTITLTQITE